MKVLLIDDSNADADLVYEYLIGSFNKSLYRNFYKGIKTELDWAIDLEVAFDKLSKNRYDIVLLDLNLGPTRGVETIDTYVGMGFDLPLVALTSVENNILWMHAFKKGVQDFIIKGEDPPEVFIRTLSYAIERHKMQKDLRNYLNQQKQYFQHLENFIYSSKDPLLLVESKQVKIANQAAKNLLNNDFLKSETFNYQISEGEKFIKIADDNQEATSNVLHVNMQLLSEIDLENQQSYLIKLEKIKECEPAYSDLVEV